jgi:hypothetical protein
MIFASSIGTGSIELVALDVVDEHEEEQKTDNRTTIARTNHPDSSRSPIIIAGSA